MVKPGGKCGCKGNAFLLYTGQFLNPLYACFATIILFYKAEQNGFLQEDSGFPYTSAVVEMGGS